MYVDFHFEGKLQTYWVKMRPRSRLSSTTPRPQAAVTNRDFKSKDHSAWSTLPSTTDLLTDSSHMIATDFEINDDAEEDDEDDIIEVA
jgi:hypothetical protein